MSKTTQLASALREAAEIRDNQEESKGVKEERSKEVKKEESKEGSAEAKVSLTAKVPKSWRRYWLIEAKKADTSLTSDIIQALTARYGLPPEGSKD